MMNSSANICLKYQRTKVLQQRVPKKKFDERPNIIKATQI